ncbi:Protein GUCD1 [Frankliniella fusca]|uniref:Protein GUCD1 n=1 Tax=Frankliniella fusca TaxID=407009 RepID=A0AAE1GT52_9NEOP|nr:Protein GUCD1 [Frankliniella fusca]
MFTDVSLPYVNIPINHMQQKYNWDCGISCVLMVLPPDKRNNLLKNFSEICADEGFFKRQVFKLKNFNTWTIDLCYLLLRYNIPHKYCTITLGVHPDYVNQNFYDKILLKDEVRVNKKFAQAANRGVSIRKRSLSDVDLQHHLSECGPVILLTNANLLHCQVCNSSRSFSDELKACLPWRSGNSSVKGPVQYHGHYIVLCGYNMSEQSYLYRNPTYKDKICSMTYTAMTQARKSHGTDEDAILIFQRKWI